MTIGYYFYGSTKKDLPVVMFIIFTIWLTTSLLLFLMVCFKRENKINMQTKLNQNKYGKSDACQDIVSSNEIKKSKPKIEIILIDVPCCSYLLEKHDDYEYEDFKVSNDQYLFDNYSDLGITQEELQSS